MVGVVVIGVSACGVGAELEVTDPPPDHPGGVVVVTTVPGDGDGSEPVFVEDPAATTSSEATTTSESTTTTPTTVATTTTPPTTAAPPPPTAPPPPPPPAAGAEASVAFVNQKRAENGRAALQVDPALVALADGWARQLAADKDLRHNPQLNQQMPSGFRAWGENVGYAWAADVIDNGWWNSEGHRNNILNAGYDSIGVAFVRDESGTYWGVQVFGGH